ncbi:winged helix-turn-helix domain-containing protein [Shewanella sp.]|uniref:winged helix-turn-helix domain-containing protein n=1 Tax=Shewanella sp. TaxID=50422 RepID=UPI004047F1E5
MLLTHKNYKISALTLDFATQTLALNTEQIVQLKPQSFQLLYYFCTNQHRIVNREELITHVWQNRIVSDNAINRAVSQLRAVIAQLDPEKEYIQTLPRAGYRLSVAVIALDTINAIPQTDTTSIAPTLNSPTTASSLGVNQAVKDPVSNPVNLQTKNPINDEKLTSITAHKYQSRALQLSLLLLSVITFGLLMFQSSPLLSKAEPRLKNVESETVTYDPGAEFDASSTRDWLVYINKKETVFNVVARHLDSDKQRNIYHTSDTIRHPKLSPNVDLMSVFLRKNEALGLRKCQLNIYRLQTAEQLKQYACGIANVVNQRWKTNTKIQIVTATEGQGLTTFELDLHKQHPSPTMSVAFTDERLRFISVQFSPNGQQIALLSRNTLNNQTHLHFLDASTLVTQHTIVMPGINISAVQYLDNGDLMWLSAGKLFITDNAGNKHTELMSDLTNITQLTSINSGNVFVSHGLTRENLVNLNSEGKETLIAPSSKDEYMPTYSHHSEQFVFFSNRTGRDEIWLNHASGDVKRIPLPKQDLQIKPLQWSPDDSKLAIATLNAIWVYSFANDNVQTININQVHQIRWLNNHELAILSHSNTDELVIIDVMSGAQSSINLPLAATSFDVVDDLVYFTQNNSQDFARYNLRTQQLDFLGVEANTNIGMWQVKQGALYYVPISQEKLHIEKLDLLTGDSHAIYYFKIADAPVFSVSSRAHILLQRQVHDETDISKINIH